MEHGNISAMDRLCSVAKSFTLYRFSLLTVACCIACIGIASNQLLLNLFVRPRVREPALAILALLDSMLCFCYVGLFGVEAWTYYLRLEFLYEIWYGYNIICFTLSRILQLSIPAVLIMISLQRWALITNKRLSPWRLLHRVKSQAFLVSSVVLLTTCIRMPMAWSITVHHFTNCSNYFGRYELWHTNFTDHFWYRALEWTVTSFQIFVPFVALVLLNTAIVLNLRAQRLRRQQTLSQLVRTRYSSRSSRRNNRGSRRTEDTRNYLVCAVSHTLGQELRRVSMNEKNAVSTMVIIVSSYILCNTLHVLLTFLEHFSQIHVNTESYWHQFYVMASDIISFLFVLCSVVRLAIYYHFNPAVRKHLFQNRRKRLRKSEENSFLTMKDDTADSSHLREPQRKPAKSFSISITSS